jgi:VanZ family protein
VALAGWLGLVVLQYWAPFDFGVSAHALGQRIAVLYTRAPFHRYYWLPPLMALSEVLTLLLLALGTSVLISLVRPSRRPQLPARTPVLLTTLIFALVEWGQLYLPSRRADPTDVVIAAAGAFMGTVIARALAGPPEPMTEDITP